MKIPLILLASDDQRYFSIIKRHWTIQCLFWIRAVSHSMIHSFLCSSSFFSTLIHTCSFLAARRSHGHTDRLCLSTMFFRTNRSTISSSRVARASDRSSHCLGLSIVLEYMIHSCQPSCDAPALKHSFQSCLFHYMPLP